jgi:dynein heavy chain
MRALRYFNIPKIVTDDKPIFLRLIDDLFPKIDVKSKIDAELKKLVMKTAKDDLGYSAEDAFALKVV